MIRPQDRLLAVVVASTLVTSAACGTPASSPKPSGSARVNIDEIFPPGPGRDLVLNNCTSCHTFVPIVILQMTKEAWERNGRDHRERVTGLSDADFEILYEYLIANFNPARLVPALPRELLDAWTSY